MIDELAKAIWATREARFPAYTRRKPDQLDEATGAFQNCREEALAVLRRLREPTPEMEWEAMEIVKELGITQASGDYIGRRIFRTMIDAAMKQEPG